MLIIQLVAVCVIHVILHAANTYRIVFREKIFLGNGTAAIERAGCGNNGAIGNAAPKMGLAKEVFKAMVEGVVKTCRACVEAGNVSAVIDEP